MSVTRVKIFFNTIRYLRAKQLYYQLYYRCRKIYHRPNTAQYSGLRNWYQSWLSPLLLTPCLTKSGEITILGDSIRVDLPILWNDPRRSKLWLYNLHYLDVLNTVDADLYVDFLNTLMDDWMIGNPPYKGNGWEPYPLSIRIINLIKWYSRQQVSVQDTRLLSLEMQVEALLKQLEYHILGNHLFANAKALVFAGSYLAGTRAELYLIKGLKILDKEVNEQFLQDGGHFELSPMYHANLLWDLCDLVNLSRRTGLPNLLQRQAGWLDVIRKSLNWLKLMSHSDGKISFFNDAAFGVAPDFSALNDYAQQLGVILPKATVADGALGTDAISCNLLQYSGYCIITLDNVYKAILDVAKIGPDYQPGHAHADSLSFELSFFGQRFFVNSGTSTYNRGAQRQHERSTKAHNTVSVNGENSSEIWSEFRVARRAYPKDLLVNQLADQVTVACSHDGYLRLPGRNIHRREWCFSKQTLVMRDAIDGQYCYAESRLYFHPSVKVTLAENGSIRCDFSENKTVWINILGANQISIEPSTWHPSFGVALENCCLVIKFDEHELVTKIEW